MNVQTITALPPDPLPGLIEQALELLPQMQDSPKKTTLANVTADAITRQIENATGYLEIAMPKDRGFTGIG